jgi:signal transduction histidine kinase
VLISVSDTGVGLPAGRADDIFNAFVTTKSQGSGMGLAISRSIVESHGGQIWANGDSGRGDVPLHLASGSRENKPSRGCHVIRHSAEWVRGPGHRVL